MGKHSSEDQLSLQDLQVNLFEASQKVDNTNHIMLELTILLKLVSITALRQSALKNSLRYNLT